MIKFILIILFPILSFAQKSNEQIALDFFTDSLYSSNFEDSKIYYDNQISSGFYRYYELQITRLQKWDSVNMYTQNWIYYGVDSPIDSNKLKCESPIICKKKLKRKSTTKSPLGWRLGELRINPIQLNMKLHSQILLDGFAYVKIELINKFRQAGYTIRL